MPRRITREIRIRKAAVALPTQANDSTMRHERAPAMAPAGLSRERVSSGVRLCRRRFQQDVDAGDAAAGA
jgi:hypothetical protein